MFKKAGSLNINEDNNPYGDEVLNDLHRTMQEEKEGGPKGKNKDGENVRVILESDACSSVGTNTTAGLMKHIKVLGD